MLFQGFFFWQFVCYCLEFLNNDFSLFSIPNPAVLIVVQFQISLYTECILSLLMCTYNACRICSGETSTVNSACYMSVRVRAKCHIVRGATFPVRF